MITIKQLDEWDACCREDGERYDDEHLAVLFAGRESLTLREVLDLPISAEDRVWVATRPDVLVDEQCEAWLEIVVSRAVINHALHCGIEPTEAWARSWLDGTDRSRDAAEDIAWTARNAMWAAAEDAAMDATEDAARNAMWAARSAMWAARSAMWAVSSTARGAASTARGAAWTAARDTKVEHKLEAAERDQQIADLIIILDNYDESSNN